MNLVHYPVLVLHYRNRADSFFHSALDLGVLDGEAHAPSIGLLSVHSCIALADAVLLAVEGARSRTDNHDDAWMRLRDYCTKTGKPKGGVQHFKWLLDKKNHFSYGDEHVREEELKNASLKMQQFFQWVLRTFPVLSHVKLLEV